MRRLLVLLCAGIDAGWVVGCRLVAGHVAPARLGRLSTATGQALQPVGVVLDGETLALLWMRCSSECFGHTG